MADNTTLPGTGEKYASEDRGGINFQKVQIESFDAHSVDAFGRWRVSNPETIFDSKLLHGDNEPLLWDEELISGTMATSGPTAAKPFIDFTSTNTTAGRRVRQTFVRFNYQPGKSQLILMTGVLELASGIKTGCQRRIGLFDDDNGAFFESDAGAIGVTVRTNDSGSPVDTTVAQASWNIDTMDGDDDEANPSGLTLDATMAQIFVIDYQWLSIGRVRFGFEIGSHIEYVHEHNVANAAVIPWASTPNLPLRYEIVTTTSSGVCSMRCICSTVISEGGTSDTGIVRHKGTAGAGVTTDTADLLVAVIGIQLKTTHLGANLEVLEALIQIHTQSEFIEWILLYGAKGNAITVAGTFTYGDLGNSAVQFALGAGPTNTVTGGVHIAGGYVQSGGNQSGGGSAGEFLHTQLSLGAAIDGTRSQLVLCVRPIGGVSAATVEGALVWRETT